MLFSVIVPIYKVEPWLSECVDSILAQTFRDFELILVDDGSPDCCPALCDAYAAGDSRVRVLHKSNGGLVSARQAGVELARGEYVVNVDGDDAVARNLLERAAELIRTHAPDLISFAVTYLEPAGPRTATEPLSEGLYNRERKEREIYPRMLMAPDMTHLFWYLCGKAIRRSLLAPCQMAVDRRISLGEDVACLMQVYRGAERVYLCRQAMYLCRVRPGSDSRSFRVEQYDQLLLVLKGLERLGGAEWEAQMDRYASFLCFGLMNSVPALGPERLPAAAVAYMKRPELRDRLRRARFSGVTAKMRITYFLFRRGWVRLASLFLAVCRHLKQGR